MRIDFEASLVWSSNVVARAVMSVVSIILRRRNSWRIHMVRHALSVSPNGLMMDVKFSTRA